MATGDVATIGRLELVRGFLAVHERDEARPDRAGIEDRHAADRALAEPFVPFGDQAEQVVGAFDIGLGVERHDRRCDRQRVEITLAHGFDHPGDRAHQIRRSRDLPGGIDRNRLQLFVFRRRLHIRTR